MQALGAGAALLLCGLNVLPLTGLLSVGGPAVTSSTPPWVLLSANLNSGNEETGALLELVTAEKPAVVILQEFTPRWASELATLRKQYRYHYELPREDNFGLALYSYWPLESTDVVALGNSTPAVTTTLVTGQGRVGVIAVHLRPPMTANWAAQRRRQFLHLTRLVTTCPNRWSWSAISTPHPGPRTFVTGSKQPSYPMASAAAG